MIRVSQLKMPLKHTEEDLKKELLHFMRLSTSQLSGYEILKRSLDARKRENIHYTYTLDVSVKEPKDCGKFESAAVGGLAASENGRSMTAGVGKDITAEEAYLKRNKNRNIAKSTTVEYSFTPSGTEILSGRPVVCGSGPAGMFCAYLLAKHGYCPIVIERGEPVEKRAETVQAFWKGAGLNPESNVQFGEGGAGTFSDGKLNTMVKDTYGRIRKVLKIFTEFGAPEEILYLNKPHIGTDYLRAVVVNMRREIIRLGGEFLFETCLTDLVLEQGKLAAIRVKNAGGEDQIETNILVAAIGHSARDTFEMLYRKGLKMEQKAFAVGVRVEHEQELINRNQYKEAAGLLPAADYKVTYTAGNGRGIYSFCMCPGGFVVNASSEPGRLVVNGMSNHDRAERNANSALIVTVTPEDFKKVPGAEDSPLAGVRFQQYYEGLAYRTGMGQIPCQLYGDLKEGRKSTGFGKIVPNLKGKGIPADLRECLPDYVIRTLLEGMEAFDRPIPGFADPEAVFSGVEMRTSSPVRLLRDERLESSIPGLYPCGEGAGYAGGITSAAVDGIKVFEAIASRYGIK